MADDAAAPGGELSDEEASKEPDATTDAVEAEDSADEAGEPDAADGGRTAGRFSMSHVRLATTLGLAAVVALAALCGWLGFRAYQSHQAAQERNLYLQARAQPFKEVVKQAKSKSVGTIAEAGVETINEDGAEVLVAVTVRTSNAGAAEQEPRAWRMRITVQKVGDDAKVANVRFVS